MPLGFGHGSFARGDDVFVTRRWVPQFLMGSLEVGSVVTLGEVLMRLMVLTRKCWPMRFCRDGALIRVGKSDPGAACSGEWEDRGSRFGTPEQEDMCQSVASHHHRGRVQSSQGVSGKHSDEGDSSEASDDCQVYMLIRFRGRWLRRHVGRVVNFLMGLLGEGSAGTVLKLTMGLLKLAPSSRGERVLKSLRIR